MIRRLEAYATEYLRVILITLLLLVLLRVVEYLAWTVHFQMDIGLDVLFSRSINFDVLHTIWISLWCLPGFLLLSFLQASWAKALLRTGALLYFFAILVDTIYFLISQTLLTGSVLEFQLQEIFKIVLAEFSLNRLPETLGLLLFLGLAIGLYFFPKGSLPLTLKRVGFALYAVALIVTWGNRSHQFKELKYFDSTLKFQLGNSKWVYFFKSLKDSTEDPDQFSAFELSKRIPAWQSKNPNFHYVDQQFPLIHQGSTQNVLAPFFPKGDKPPNIVLVITESLSASFVGDSTQVGNLMPFTDSLLHESLYWPNFLSNAERSYGALPSLLASSPAGIGERGFVNMKVELDSGQRYPNQLSLISLLKDNGYHTHFYYGGWIDFDNIGVYLRHLGIDEYSSDVDFDPEVYLKNDGSRNKMVWGYNDKDVFRFSLLEMDQSARPKPYLNIYQTLSIHSPFNLVEEHYYDQEFQQKRIDQLPNIDRERVSKIPNAPLASILFADDALRQFMQAYQHRPDFEETIFIITGDHAIDLGLDQGPFKNYRIPLMIYSPNLKRTGHFPGLHSHLDVLPSLQALLQENYGLSFPGNQPWMGNGLDTVPTFQSNQIIPLNIQAMELPNFVYRNQVVWGNEVYRIQSNLSLIPEPDAVPREEAMKAFEDYRYINQYVCRSDKIWPAPVKQLEF
ncbi:LTA synthase family protein [bacterium SCSIO 12741]|nr:LTA synthase family protein [bacterium SCSIO 12741]